MTDIKTFSITQEFEGIGYPGQINARSLEEAQEMCEMIGATVNGELREDPNA